MGEVIFSPASPFVFLETGAVFSARKLVGRFIDSNQTKLNENKKVSYKATQGGPETPAERLVILPDSTPNTTGRQSRCKNCSLSWMKFQSRKCLSFKGEVKLWCFNSFS